MTRQISVHRDTDCHQDWDQPHIHLRPGNDGGVIVEVADKPGRWAKDRYGNLRPYGIWAKYVGPRDILAFMRRPRSQVDRTSAAIRDIEKQLRAVLPSQKDEDDYKHSIATIRLALAEDAGRRDA